jgi:putative nucleotidyltransferase with HDIG domain
MQALHTAAFLHDIGKLAVPEHIINKPGKLTPEEFEKMKIHPVVGADILARVKFPYPVVPIVRSHHEAWDGSGYPDGLKGEDIPIGARILTVVDCFDALASDRPYRRAMPIDDAMALVKSKAGIQFDPEIVSLLEERYPELEKLARQQTSEMEPLKTNIFVERGAAPGAGFEVDPATVVAPGIATTPTVNVADPVLAGLSAS